MSIIEKGKVYSANDIDKVILINFPIDSAVKVYYFDQIKSSVRNELKEEIDKMCNIHLRTIDWLGKIMVVSMYFFTQGTDMIIVNTAGLANHSILFLQENLSIIAEKLNKVAIVTRGNITKVHMEGGIIVG